MSAVLARFLRDCSGATALEYALIGSLVSIAIVAAVTVVGVNVNGMFSTMSSKFD